MKLSDILINIQDEIDILCRTETSPQLAEQEIGDIGTKSNDILVEWDRDDDTGNECEYILDIVNVKDNIVKDILIKWERDDDIVYEPKENLGELNTHDNIVNRSKDILVEVDTHENIVKRSKDILVKEDKDDKLVIEPRDFLVEEIDDYSNTESDYDIDEDEENRKNLLEVRRSSSHDFTVTKVTDSEQRNNARSASRLPSFDTIDEQTEFLQANGKPITPTDTLTNNSITALLSNKWRDLSKKIRDYGEKTRFRKRIVSKWESLNYDTIENELHWREKEKPNTKRQLTLQFVHRWLIVFFIGLLTAVLAAAVHILVEKISHAKFTLIQSFLERCSKESCLYQPFFIWIGINLSVTCLGSALVVYLQPKAAGSGIPLIKSYLNGVKIPGLLTLECFVAKVAGVVMSILGGLACGKEGPMAHGGSIIAAGLGRGRVRLPCKNKRVSLYEGFRDDREIRDFVSAGAASGVSAAFGAPVGGTLFSVEEAASFWSQSLTWRVFFSAMISCFFTNLLLSVFHGTPNQLSAPGLVRFNVFPNLSFDLIEIPVFLIMAVVGGLIGAAFVVLNYKLTVFRNRYIKLRWLKVIEAGAVAVVTGAASFVLIVSLSQCTDKEPYDDHAIVAQMGCPEGQHHSMSTIFLATPEGCLKALLHDPYGSFGPITLSVFVVVFFFLAVWTYGLNVSSGVFIPCLVIGAAWGRLFGIAVVNLFPGDQEHFQKEVGKYALIGAASQLGGVLRTTISLTVMIVECTGEITFGLPIMIVLMISKWVGDFISTGLYDMNIEVLGLPLLPWDPPALCDNIKASDIMNSPACCLNKIERVGRVVDLLRNETFCGFPVVNAKGLEYSKPSKIRGLILRSQLLVLLKHKIFSPDSLMQPDSVRLKDFRKYYLQYLRIQDIAISDEERDYMMDLRPYITPNPYTIEPSFSFARLFKLFRGLGLRHLVVVNDCNEPIGMITRKDLAKFRVESKRGLVKVEQLNIEDK
ncbi:H(+)/Cl(-) exchange transporter 7-like isoform X2 [Mya arenaria]|uniref:H(+)/Cl(-) exchange transporter 7-like isoform X2 n=1 Tax=Mya arenaria TaxID=6604 RepID=UPI0022E64108|nr:H(+)/Cl(-) exchange transporter 7-like isoform X2 [Mya arenaria]